MDEEDFNQTQRILAEKTYDLAESTLLAVRSLQEFASKQFQNNLAQIRWKAWNDYQENLDAVTNLLSNSPDGIAEREQPRLAKDVVSLGRGIVQLRRAFGNEAVEEEVGEIGALLGKMFEIADQKNLSKHDRRKEFKFFAEETAPEIRNLMDKLEEKISPMMELRTVLEDSASALVQGQYSPVGSLKHLFGDH
ncbi:mfs transporter [Lasius niger]|uniref:Mfs transporter n=1 Tax=Lasius niger TaxID=67767 RepID=A0A0J7NCA1_LASNI|nr:mfs transporter [Lasius niger]